MVNHLATNMATNMTELMAMLRNQNQASSSFTPPLEHRPIVDPNPTVPPTFVSEVEDASFSAMAFAPTVHPINDPLPPPPAPVAVPLPPAAFLFADSTMHTLPPLTVRSCWDEVVSLKPYLCGSDVFDLPKAELVARRLPVGLPETGFAAEE
ncbi:hypothetical protein CDL15_Pgr023997 [Punica granatum]|uniref:Uncharacterized protein n=1 Tax=Punica granatum TaxID=22663 RepID=A0A218XV36_PUNGR|nr:hypothetical protein CDL15_Pgr023997 [Punica granatum]